MSNLPQSNISNKLKYYKLKCILCGHVFGGYYSAENLQIQSACKTCANTLNTLDCYLQGIEFDSNLHPSSEYADTQYTARHEMAAVVSYLMNHEKLFLNKLKKWAEE